MNAQILIYSQFKAQRDAVPVFNDLLKQAMDNAFKGESAREQLKAVYTHYPEQYDFVFHKCQLILEAAAQTREASETGDFYE